MNFCPKGNIDVNYDWYSSRIQSWMLEKNIDFISKDQIYFWLFNNVFVEVFISYLIIFIDQIKSMTLR